MPNNVIEVVAKLKDELSGPLAGMSNTLKSFKGALAAGVGGLSIASAFSKVIAESTEAERTLTQFNRTFQQFGYQAGLSRQALIEFADSAQKSTQFSDDAVRASQTTLLRFSNVVGDNFKRAQSSILDVAAALGIDLQSAAFSVGRALEQPEQGLRQLRSLGVIFSDSQQKVIQNLAETGRVAQAQRVLLDALEKAYKGSADAAGQTLTGALAKLKNKFGELFELNSTDQFSKLSLSIKGLGDSLEDPKVKQGFQDLLSNLLQAATLLARGAAAIPRFGSAIGELVAPQAPGASKGLEEELKSEQQKLTDLQKTLQFNMTLLEAEPKKRLQEEIRLEKAYIETLKQRIALAKQIEAQDAARAKFPQAAANNAADSIIDKITTGKPRDVTDLGAIRDRQNEREAARNKRILEMRDSIQSIGSNPELQAVDGLARTLDQNADAIQKKLEKVFATKQVKEFTDTLKEGLENAARSGETSGRAILRSLLAAFESKLIFNAIDNIAKYLQSALSQSSAGGGGKSFFGSLVSGAIGAFFGHAAGGGRTYGPTIVGEDGPELVMGTGQIYNRRQLAFMGGGTGGGVTITNNNTFNVDGTASPEATARYIETRLAQNNRKQAEAWGRTMKANGFGDIR